MQLLFNCVKYYLVNKLTCIFTAEVVKLVDAPDSKSGIPWDVWVQIPPSVQLLSNFF